LRGAGNRTPWRHIEESADLAEHTMSCTERWRRWTVIGPESLHLNELMKTPSIAEQSRKLIKATKS
jgi:hypothetical protein